MRCFFYGTLMDPDVLGAVIGCSALALRRERAVLSGYRRVYRQGAWYPILIPAPAKAVEGLLVASLASTERERLVAFEGDDYELVERTVRTTRGDSTHALTFIARPHVAASTQEWTLADWRRRHKREYLRRARARLATRS